MIPFANSFAVFLTGRAFDQIRQQVALPALNVKLAGSSAGITQGLDGATHQSVLDVALMRSLPNMCVIVPSDAEEARLATLAAAERDGPVYLRLSRYETPTWRDPGVPFRVGEVEVRRPGQDVTIAVCGAILGRALEAAAILAIDGLSAEVLNVHTIEPLDADALLASCERTGAVVTVEEHSIIGGLGSAVAEVLSERAARRLSFRRLGVADTSASQGPRTSSSRSTVSLRRTSPTPRATSSARRLRTRVERCRSGCEPGCTGKRTWCAVSRIAR